MARPWPVHAVHARVGSCCHFEEAGWTAFEIRNFEIRNRIFNFEIRNFRKKQFLIGIRNFEIEIFEMPVNLQSRNFEKIEIRKFRFFRNFRNFRKFEIRKVEILEFSKTSSSSMSRALSMLELR